MKVEEDSLTDLFPFLGVSQQAVLVPWERCRDTAHKAYQELLQLVPAKGIVPVFLTLSQIERYWAEATLDQITTEVIMRQLQKPAWQVVVGQLPETAGLQFLLNWSYTSHCWLKFPLMIDCSPGPREVVNDTYYLRIYNAVNTVRGLQPRLGIGTPSTLTTMLFLSREAYEGFQQISEDKNRGRLESYGVYDLLIAEIRAPRI